MAIMRALTALVALATTRPGRAAVVVSIALLGAQPAAAAGAAYAYVYPQDVGGGQNALALDFESFLDGHGFPTDLVATTDVAATDFSAYTKILIADDTGLLDQWGLPIEGQGAALAAYLESFGRPFVAIGEGGYALFGRLGLASGWPGGWHGPADTWLVPDAADPVFHTPNEIALATNPLFQKEVQVYTSPVDEVAIYAQDVPTSFTGLALEPATTAFVSCDNRDAFGLCPLGDHYPLTRERGQDFLWGASGGPSAMTEAGRALFLNVVAYPVPEPTSALAGLAAAFALGACARWRALGGDARDPVTRRA